MTESPFDRRDFLAVSAVVSAGAAMITPAAVLAQASAAPAAKIYAPQPVPLPFDPKTIPGFSEKLLTSHHNNNYVGAVRRLGAIGGQLAMLDPATAPNFVLNGLKREELIAWNSMVLHEIYFAQFGQPNRPGTMLAAAIEKHFGSEARWRSEFLAMGKALGGGSGWVVLAYSHRDKRLVNQWAADHTVAMADATPVLILDMYEHAYAIDYGARAAAYVDAFLPAVNWSNADKRFAKAAA